MPSLPKTPHPLNDPTMLETLKQDSSWLIVKKDLDLMVELDDGLLPQPADLVSRLVALADAVKDHSGLCVLNPRIQKYLLVAADRLNVQHRTVLALQAQIMEYERVRNPRSETDSPA